MGSFSGLGIGLSLVFGCLFLAIVAELYYVLFWKKRRINHREEIEDDYGTTSNYGKEYLIQLFCWKKPSSLNTTTRRSTQDCERGQVNVNGHELSAAADTELGTSKDLLMMKSFSGDESEISELMRLHNLSGPPRFLFTIKEETKEDLESDDGKSKGVGDLSGRRSRTRSLSDLMLTVESPFLTPLASPRVKALDSSSYNHHGFNNPLFESSSSSSPPPKFKFLRDAEEKLLKRLMIEEAEKRAVQNSVVKTLNTSSSNLAAIEVTEGSFLKFIVGHQLRQQQCPSSNSQVLPLASSPITFRPVLDQKPTVH